MAELFSQIEQRESRSGDWLVRILIAAIFAITGAEKFVADPHWTHLFAAIGWGDWFRYFTGGVEVAGAALVLIPRTVWPGLALLAGTMAGAAALVAFKLHAHSDALFPGLLMTGLLAFAALRKRS